MRIAAVQFDIVWEDKAANHTIIERMITDASPSLEPGTFVLLPELGDTGFSMNLNAIANEHSLHWARALAIQTKCFVQHGFARLQDQKGKNCAAIFAADGTAIGEYQKVHPFSYGKESQYYTGGNHLSLVNCNGAIVCPMICYDLRFPELWRLAAMNGAEVFTIGASWPARRQHHWRALLIARAIENQAFVVAVNRVGNDPHLSYAGGSIVIAPSGEILAETFDQPQVLQAKLDLESLRSWRAEFPALRDIHRDLLGQIRVLSE